MCWYWCWQSFINEWSSHSFINVVASNHAQPPVPPDILPSAQRSNVNTRNRCLDLNKCWVKNHLQTVDTRAFIQINVAIAIHYWAIQIWKLQLVSKEVVSLVTTFETWYLASWRLQLVKSKHAIVLYKWQTQLFTASYSTVDASFTNKTLRMKTLRIGSSLENLYVYIILQNISHKVTILSLTDW